VDARDRALAELDRLRLLPTLIVGSSPGRFHFWWRLDEPMDLAGDDAKRVFERVLAAIAARIGADGAVKDCSRVLRLPGTRNVKPWYEAATPVDVLEAWPERTYPFARFAELVPPAPTKGKVKTPKAATESAAMTTAMPAVATLPHLDRCSFVRHCCEQSTTLSEPLWTALAWTLAPSGDAGDAAFHALSRAHPTYNAADAAEKLRYAREQGYQPPSCRTIGERGFVCPRMDLASGACALAPVRSPAALLAHGPAVEGSGFVRGRRTWRSSRRIDLRRRKAWDDRPAAGRRRPFIAAIRGPAPSLLTVRIWVVDSPGAIVPKSMDSADRVSSGYSWGPFEVSSSTPMSVSPVSSDTPGLVEPSQAARSSRTIEARMGALRRGVRLRCHDGARTLSPFHLRVTECCQSCRPPPDDRAVPADQRAVDRLEDPRRGDAPGA
jgi:hypothetical protein